jgi:hypothetical protein
MTTAGIFNELKILFINNSCEYRNFPGCKGQTVYKADNLTTICESVANRLWDPWTFHNPMGLHRLLEG